MHLTRRGVQLALAGLWLLDAALQYQPYMFGHGFASQIVAPTGDGQPAAVVGGVTWAAGLIGSHTILLNAVFATAQLLLAAGLVWRPTVRITLIASIGWSLSVWYLGEGLGGIASGHADLLTGAPGAALLYAVLAAAAWPPFVAGTTGLRQWTELPPAGPPARWTPLAWALLWIGSGVLRALPGQNTGRRTGRRDLRQRRRRTGLACCRRPACVDGPRRHRHRDHRCAGRSRGTHRSRRSDSRPGTRLRRLRRNRVVHRVLGIRAEFRGALHRPGD